VHVTLRVVSAVGSLRKRAAYHAIRQATLTAAAHCIIRIVHASIQRTHLHLLVEAKDKKALAVGMQSFQISAAKHLNVAVGKMRREPRRRGTVFPDRYHAEIITSPTQTRRALAYALANFRKHGEDRAVPMDEWKVDLFSSAMMFPGWAEYGEDAFLWRWPPTYDPLWVWRPQTWLLAEGWKKVSSAISCHEVPSSR
jgi:REP element-mobilizing transposase RayT